MYNIRTKKSMAATAKKQSIVKSKQKNFLIIKFNKIISLLLNIQRIITIN